MARQSADAKAAAAFRVTKTANHPQPPAKLPPEAAELWREIVECRAVDFFRPGSLQMLEQFCRLTVINDQYLEMLEADPLDEEGVLQKITKLAPNLRTMATKLRITVTAETGRWGLEGEGGKLTEKATKKAPLLGGFAVQAADFSKVETRIKN